MRGRRSSGSVPILMTALVTALGLLPLALGSGDPGREIEGPMAIVILGGLITSTVLSLFVLPTLALRFGRFGRRERESLSPACLRLTPRFPLPPDRSARRPRPSQRNSRPRLRRRAGQQDRAGRHGRPPPQPVAQQRRRASASGPGRPAHGEHRRVGHDHQHVLAQRLDAPGRPAPRCTQAGNSSAAPFWISMPR